VAHPEIGRKKYLGLFSQPTAARLHPQEPSSVVSPCTLLVPGRLPSSAYRPPASATRPPRRPPYSCCRLPVACRAAVPGCRPRPPTHLPFGPSDGPASLLDLARWHLRPPSLPARLGTVAPPASLPPCSVRRRPPPSLTPCLLAPLLRARLLGCLLGRCAAVLGAGHPALRASGASLLDRLHCSPGFSALCDCARYYVCFLSLICLD
jgi:hypothetical protein